MGKSGSATAVVGIHIWPMIWGLLAALIEAVGGFLLIIGLAFRPVCLLLMVELIIAALFMLHQKAPDGGLMAASHAIEDAIMFAGLLFVGPGKHSIDKK